MRGKAAQALASRSPAASRSHVGLDPGLVDEDQPPRVEAACQDLQRCRRRAMSERACSRANSVFFEPQSLAPQEQPDRVVRDLHPAIRQFVLQTMKRQMWGLV